ncbi:DUF4395 domain-containing protein [Rhodobaculum claviforme]|uniref:DUF4395 domain-containing protein n=1 Tax=Rhodobaculum claviforme TaxID=1549854 RepID=A0A934TIL5_9RHOB|nr:DUF4395 domain-containing protein [Rhodobaculum claviforme]MBK5926211.1 hypothetical protein [Rhodobaculum claviforme]
MSKLFQFGERMDEFPVPVLNEREVRAGAGILVFAAIIAFTQAFQMGNFTPMRLVVLAFFVDFAIRVLVNPRYAPSLVLGRLITRGQEPEYVGAPQKRFAWALGLGMATVAITMVYGFNTAGPVLLALCTVCIALMFMEAAFGICVGCKMYSMFASEKAQMCPGNACSFGGPAPITRVEGAHLAVLAAVVVALAVALPYVAAMDAPVQPLLAMR